MIGIDAKQKREITYTEMFDRLTYMGNLFRIAESVANSERPLINVNPRSYSMERNEIRVEAFSDVPVSEHDNLVLAVGSVETGFYQVPIIKISGGMGKDAIDVMVSGTINDKGTAERFEKAKKLSEMSQELYHVGTENARKVCALALMPKTDLLGQDVLVAGRNMHQPHTLYHMIVNGFAMDRQIVGSRGYFGWVNSDPTFTPVMFHKDGIERFLKVGEILDQEQLAQAESQGVFPGLTFVTGTFRKFEQHFSPSHVLYSMGSDNLGTMRGATKGVGRVGLDVGSESDVKYGQIKGDITSINGILALHFLGVEKDTDPAHVKAEIEKLVR
jgi:hypothetical protein